MRYGAWRRQWPIAIAGVAIVGLLGLMLQVPFWYVVALVYAVLVWLLTEFRVRRLAAAQAKAAALNGDTRYAFSDEGIHCESKHGQSRYGWAALARAYEGAETVFLVFPNTFAMCLPYRVMTAEQLGELRALVKRQLGAKASLKA